MVVALMLIFLAGMLYLTFRPQGESQFPSCGPQPSGYGCL